MESHVPTTEPAALLDLIYFSVVRMMAFPMFRQGREAVLFFCWVLRSPYQGVWWHFGTGQAL